MIDDDREELPHINLDHLHEAHVRMMMPINLAKARKQWLAEETEEEKFRRYVRQGENDGPVS